MAFGHIFSSRALAGVRLRRAEAKDIFALPQGFSQKVLQRTGELMTDGFSVPGRPDGMAAFPGADGGVILMRNHELKPTDRPIGPFANGQEIPPAIYDQDHVGSVTRVIVDPKTLTVRSSNMVLVGTNRNCAGGWSPWGWLSCEESFDDRHGYVFLCDPQAGEVRAPVRIPGYGKFMHEAATVDPRTAIAYLTEDRRSSCLYRFVPTDPARPFVGKLQALKVVGQPELRTWKNLRPGDRFAVTWVEVDDPTPASDTVRRQAHRQGAAKIRRGEGLWLHQNSLFVSSTSGGPAHAGQIFELEIGREGEPDYLRLVAQSMNRGELDMPDNITVSPRGSLYVSEDGKDSQFIRMITSDGRVVDFGKNHLSSSEITGICFGPSGNTMFCNIQHDGITLAIRGPFEQFERQS